MRGGGFLGTKLRKDIETDTFKLICKNGAICCF
jgi:hypothetical protein